MNSNAANNDAQLMNIFKSAIENYKCEDGQSLEKHADCTILY